MSLAVILVAICINNIVCKYILKYFCIYINQIVNALWVRLSNIYMHLPWSEYLTPYIADYIIICIMHFLHTKGLFFKLFYLLLTLTKTIQFDIPTQTHIWFLIKHNVQYSNVSSLTNTNLDEIVCIIWSYSMCICM